MASPHKFVQEPDQDLICQICHEVADDPQQESDCGKIFCSSCVWKMRETKNAQIAGKDQDTLKTLKVSYLDTQNTPVALLDVNHKTGNKIRYEVHIYITLVF